MLMLLQLSVTMHDTRLRHVMCLVPYTLMHIWHPIHRQHHEIFLLISAYHQTPSFTVLACRLTDAELLDNLLMLLVAGHDTTSSALTLAMANMQQHPQVGGPVVQCMERHSDAGCVPTQRRCAKALCTSATAAALAPPADSWCHPALLCKHTGLHTVHAVIHDMNSTTSGNALYW